jgi:uncharacterized protein (DUF58 family)
MAMRKKNKSRQQTLNPLIFIITGGGLMLLVALALLIQAGTRGAPQLSVDRELVDFGPVKMGEMVTASFTITNTGSAPLVFSEIPRVRVVAGC